MRIIIGSPPTGGDFYPRQSVIDQLVRALEVEHVLFLAPRRTGKTSILFRLREVAPAQAAFIDLEGLDHPQFWIRSMVDSVRAINDERWLQIVKKMPDFLRGFKSDLFEISETNWEDSADHLMHDLNQLGTPVWFLLDEFPIMVDKIANRYGKAEASAALHWLRRIRQHSTGSPVRFLLTGSIGLDSVMQRHGMRGIANDLRREILPPQTKEDALAFTLQLANNNQISLDEALAREFINRLGPAIWPFFIQLFVAECQDYVLRYGEPVDLDKVYQTVALGRRNQYADNMWARLRDIFSETEASVARQILKIIATHENGLPLENLRGQLPDLPADDFRTVLDTLEHDGYLVELANGNIAFFSHLLRDYWRHKGRV
ncbi:hypothetical protein [Nitrosomonas sp.]|uniref:hypothetical protein n=1 Tax=Nitrosomonas sp. TaxID=42353 RepID=UPI002844D793|nr:hypothetical protein [Nitrosomonas sp.]MDR4514289.1 hypothetical protein [Nitrosomonas sp.]